MAVTSLNNEQKQILNGNGGICVRDSFEEIRGGRSLDVTGFTPTVIQEGHVIIHETATGEYKPMPVSGSAYAALPGGHTYAGILRNTIETAKPLAGIVIRGSVNPAAAPYDMTSILAAVKTALPLITFLED